ncbi:hypothetical protein Megpolyxen_00685 [Candidatus Megaera polyxenophila]|nr:hypothetical protein Megpolyxen_00685 [Candidatus Megaera polyxenophila]
MIESKGYKRELGKFTMWVNTNLTTTMFKDLILATGVMKVYHHGFDN